MQYADLLASKMPAAESVGREPKPVHESLFGFQKALTEWVIRKGRAALFADTGLGKTRMQLSWAAQMDAPTLIVAPLAVAEQTIEEALALDMEVEFVSEQRNRKRGIFITNYEKLHRFDPSKWQSIVLVPINSVDNGLGIFGEGVSGYGPKGWSGHNLLGGMMSTGIEWTDETWNPVTGCTKVSPGCDNCYAERITNRFGGPGAFDTVVLHPERLDQPLHWRKPRRVFVNSMSDLFHGDIPEDFIAQVFAVMALTPQHTYQVLTKRPGRMASLLRTTSFEESIDEAFWVGQQGTFDLPLPNVWLGVSVEDQKWADVRIPKLLGTPAAVRFLSCEPLLGPITFRWRPWIGYEPGWRERGETQNHLDALKDIDWCIVGGESGPGARPMELEWARSLRDECLAASVPFFFKQWGGVNKKQTGRELDGKLWDEFPYLASLPV